MKRAAAPVLVGSSFCGNRSGGKCMNLFREMALSVYSFKSYREFIKNRRIKVFGFGAVFMLIYFCLSTLLPFAESQIRNGGFGSNLQSSVPDFQLKDGRLWVDGVIEYESPSGYIYIDTDLEYYFYSAEEMEDYLYGYSSAILMDSEKMILKGNGSVQELYFSQINAELGKQDLMKLVPYLYVIIGFFMIFVYVWETALYFFGALFVALLGMVVASCMKFKLAFGRMYVLGIYSRTLPLVIKVLLSLLPFQIPLFFIANFGLSLLVIGCAVYQMQESEKIRRSESF